MRWRALALLALLAPAPAGAAPAFDPFTTTAIEPKLGAALPERDGFRDATGAPVTLGDYLGRRPAIVAPIDVGCTNICGVTLAGLAGALEELELDPASFTVLAISIDPRDTPAAARAWSDRRPAGSVPIRFLVDDGSSARHLTEAMGFHYAYDPDTDQYAHPAAVAVVTPDGHLARWLYGYPFEADDLRLALTEASAGAIGTLADHLWLLCYGYDPATGTYSARVDQALKAAGGLTVALVGAFVLLMLRRERRARERAP